MSWSITDVFGLDDEMLEMVPKPVASLLLLFPITDQIGAFYKEQQNKIDEPDHEVSAFLMPMASVQGHLGVTNVLQWGSEYRTSRTPFYENEQFES